MQGSGNQGLAREERWLTRICTCNYWYVCQDKYEGCRLNGIYINVEGLWGLRTMGPCANLCRWVSRRLAEEVAGQIVTTRARIYSYEGLIYSYKGSHLQLQGPTFTATRTHIYSYKDLHLQLQWPTFTATRTYIYSYKGLIYSLKNSFGSHLCFYAAGMGRLYLESNVSEIVVWHWWSLSYWTHWNLTYRESLSNTLE